MPVGETLAVASLYLVVINVVSAVAFAWDKYCAANGRWRMPERTLLAIAALGGTIGALLASRYLRHKTRKEPFRSILWSIAAIQLIALTGLLIPGIRNAVWRVVQQTLSHGA